VKNLTTRLKNASVLKWERFIRDVKAEANPHPEADSPYDYIYWKDCGVCAAAIKTNALDACSVCSLPKRIRLGMPVCSDYSTTHASEAIRCADLKDWVQALAHAKIILDTLNRMRIGTPIKERKFK
jgi:hypothetical protein